MTREELLSALNKVSPALRADDLDSLLKCFWFTGKQVLAYNNGIAIQAPLDTPFKAALPGKILLDELSASRAQEIEFIDKTNNLIIKAGRTKMDLAKDPSDFTSTFTMPGGFFPPLKIEALLDAIESCMRSIGSDPSVPDQLGITLTPLNGGLILYATNNATISSAEVKDNFGIKRSIILSDQFCKEMLKLRGPNSRIAFDKEHTLFTNGSEMLYGKLLVSAKPLDFATIFKHHTPEGYKKQMVTIRPEKNPEALEEILNKAAIWSEYTEHKSCQIIVNGDGYMRFLAESKLGKLNDALKIGSNHPQVDTNVEPKLIKQGSKFFDKWVVTEQAVLMEKGDMRYLIGTTGRAS